MGGFGHGRFSIGIAAIAVIGIAVALAVLYAVERGNEAFNTATVPVPRLEKDFYDWYERHEAVIESARNRPVDLVLIGDSITHLFGGEPPSGRARGAAVWTEFYGERDVLNLGFGWDRTQNVLWRLEHGELAGYRPRAVVLLIGANNLVETRQARRNTPAEIAEGISAICREIRRATPGCQVLLVGLLPRRSLEFVEPIRETNRLLARLADGEDTVFLDLAGEFAMPDGTARAEFMHDDVHPNAQGYRVWATAMETLLADWLSP